MLTGHSLGAALTTVAAFEDWGTNVNFINFGSPRVGNSEFEKAFRSRVSAATRVTHLSDLVVQMPKAMLGYSYQHISQETYYDTDTHFKKCSDTSKEDPTCSISTWGISIADHLKYLGMSTGCYDSDSTAVEYLRNSTVSDASSTEFYGEYDSRVLPCGDNGFILGVAKNLHKNMNQKDMKSFITCFKEDLIQRYENFFYEELVKAPTCSDVEEWGKLAIQNCLSNSNLAP